MDWLHFIGKAYYPIKEMFENEAAKFNVSRRISKNLMKSFNFNDRVFLFQKEKGKDRSVLFGYFNVESILGASMDKILEELGEKDKTKKPEKVEKSVIRRCGLYRITDTHEVPASLPEIAKKIKSPKGSNIMIGGSYKSHEEIHAEIPFQQGFRPFDYESFKKKYEEAQKAHISGTIRVEGLFYVEVKKERTPVKGGKIIQLDNYMKRPTTKALSEVFDQHLNEFLKGELEPESFPEELELPKYTGAAGADPGTSGVFLEEETEYRDFKTIRGIQVNGITHSRDFPEVIVSIAPVDPLLIEPEHGSQERYYRPLQTVDPLLIEPEPNVLIDVFYGTNRDNLGGSNLKEFYGKKRSTLKYGICTVSIPQNKHKMGEIERPPKLWFLELKENPKKHFMISSIQEKSTGEFRALLAQKVAGSEDKDAFVFVHGYNVSFSTAAMRTAQIAFDIGFQGAPIMYSWPSDGKILGYFGDGDDVKATIPCLTEFLEKVIEWSKAKRIHLIAHSMGNVCLIEALLAVVEKSKNKMVFNNIILASPDIDRDVFKDQIAPKMTQYKNAIERITLYASSQDHALSLSRIIRRNNIPRAGEGGRRILVIKGIDTIDASMVGTDWLGHGFFASEPTVINDLFALIKNGLPPKKRKLIPSKTKDHLIYWKFPRV